MTEEKMMRLSQVARKLNVGISTIAEHLKSNGVEIEAKPNAKVSTEQFNMLRKAFATSAMEKEEASGLKIGKTHGNNLVLEEEKKSSKKSTEEEKELLIKNVPASTETPSSEKEPVRTQQPAAEVEKAEIAPPQLKGPKVLGKIDLDSSKKSKSGTEAAPSPAKEQKPAAKEVKKTSPATKTPQEKESVPAEKPKKETPKASKPKASVVSEKKEKPSEKKPQVESKEEPSEKKEKVESKDVKPEEKTEKVIAPSTEGQKVEVIEAKADPLKGLTVLGKIELPATRRTKKKGKPVASSDEKGDKKKRPRKRINKSGDSGQGGQARGGQQGQGGQAGRGGQQGQGGQAGRGGQGGRGGQAGRGGQGGRGGQNRNQQRGKGKRGQFRKDQQPVKAEVSDKEIQEQIKQTLAKLSGGNTKKSATSRAKYRKDKRGRVADAEQERMLQEQENAKKLQVTEFISANDLATLLGVSVNEVISTCMMMGLFVSINQRLDAESITLIADEFGYEAEFASADDEIEVEETEDTEEQLLDRAPIVTIMGHVDHGKTSLLDFIRNSKITEGEAGGITQHIGAYDVTTESGKRIAFLDTPGHEAFTAMRARGAQLTDVAIIVVAADDNVMPQTKEAINHAQVANVPIVIAINKIDKPQANPDKIREELANLNILVEDWGGKYQCQEISAKTGQGIDELLEKVILESELLELKANPDKKAVGSIVEASLDKGRGYVATIMVQAGTMKIGDVMLAGSHYGKVKAMFDHRGKKLTKVGPSTPVQVLGLDGAPQAGDKFNIMDTDREARDIANKREQILREQAVRTKKHITLDEIGRRLAIGSFKELNVIIKGDVDGSIEALSDSLLKLSTDEIQVNIIHKAVGQISESDVLLATASDAIIIGFQVRPSPSARKLAENEEIEIRLYSIIYDAINELKDAMEGMLDPDMEEVITGNVEVRETFKISKVGTVAGCYVTDGFIKRNNKIRLIREGIVTYEGELGQLKRFKDDVAEVKQGYECGISIQNFNDIKIGDVIEGFEQKEVKRKL
ncbi:MAG: translation initiation factor IF-2 [Cytophagales bacterium]|nr:translation initiation factor IF-2 [Cytophagales bacterium]